ncbi:MAG: flagellar basal body-associated FliL family protein [Oscillospiraceae bacterium]|jgi:flagellar basal body-associated protein FliL|nr:flagellar basal body-associated FliL family protein [Oscillospiraceae bacterium]
MKKAVIVLVCALVLGGSAGALLYIKSLPPRPVYYTFKNAKESFTSDIAGSKKHVAFTPYLKISGKGHDRELEKSESIILSAILFSIRGKTEDELSNNAVVRALSDEILLSLSEHMETGFIEAVLFSRFFIA